MEFEIVVEPCCKNFLPGSPPHTFCDGTSLKHTRTGRDHIGDRDSRDANTIVRYDGNLQTIIENVGKLRIQDLPRKVIRNYNKIEKSRTWTIATTVNYGMPSTLVFCANDYQPHFLQLSRCSSTLVRDDAKLY